eukprot:TRINITY_DN5143_c0_g1_i2.p1 TRINITY_DN5143_c0_g1~~TRINITY_DN5143_c0_g1_i2.p1  ORF type:complete len:222 (+),score=81.59 TRINITY_DN5143_c0_g1_i2:207-872(+)
MKDQQRVFLCRHAEAQHNATLDYSIKDPVLTPKGEEQAKNIDKAYPNLFETGFLDLIVISPMRRTIQTALFSFCKLGVPIVIHPEIQEAGQCPCDTGSDVEVLQKEFPFLDFSNVPQEWNSKSGFWSCEPQSLRKRAASFRKWLKSRKERNIAIVTHGAFLSFIVDGFRGFANVEVREVHFEGDLLVPSKFEDKVKQKIEGPADPTVKKEEEEIAKKSGKQ